MKLKTASVNGGWFFRLMSFLSKYSRTLLAGAVSIAAAWQGLFFLIRPWAVWEKGGLYLTTGGGGESHLCNLAARQRLHSLFSPG